MAERAFRFGVVAPASDGESYLATARRVEELGYSTLLTPDGPRLTAPFPALAMAAAATSTLRVGTYVLAGPLRTPGQAAWEGHSLSVLSGGRFEFGIGTGIPEARQSAERLGMSYGPGSQRLAQVEQSIDRLRELDSADARTPVLVAARGPKARKLAAAKADIVTLAADPLAPRTEIAQMARDLWEQAAAPELAMNLFAVGDDVPSWTEQFIGTDANTLIEHDSLVLLRGSVRQMADELQRRRDRLGISYISVNAVFAEQLAPVVELLHGH